MQQRNGKITLTYRENTRTGRRDIHVEVKDIASRLKVLECVVNFEDVSDLFSSLGDVPMTYKLTENFARIGKTVEHKTLSICLPQDTPKYGKEREEVAARVIKEWHEAQPDKENIEPSYYFESKGCFNTAFDGIPTVTITVRYYK